MVYLKCWKQVTKELGQGDWKTRHAREQHTSDKWVPRGRPWCQASRPRTSRVSPILADWQLGSCLPCTELQTCLGHLCPEDRSASPPPPGQPTFFSGTLGRTDCSSLTRQVHVCKAVWRTRPVHTPGGRPSDCTPTS